MRTSRRNQQLLFTLLLAVVVAAVAAYLFDNGLAAVGEKKQVLQMADELARCKTQEEYLALLRRHYPPDSRLWKAPAMIAGDRSTSVPVQMEILRDGRLKVVVFAMGAEKLLQIRNYVYLPATLVDNRGVGYKIEDVQLNSRRSDIVFEYIFANPLKESSFPERWFSFFLGRCQWRVNLPAGGLDTSKSTRGASGR